MTKKYLEKAESITNKVIDYLKNNKTELRKVLTLALETRTYALKGFENFGKYLKYCLNEANSDMSIDYARKQANAGSVEKLLFGREGIGTMSEGALRPLHDNVRKQNRKTVYEAARVGLKKNEYPTGEQIIKTAKDLGLFKEKLKKTVKKAESEASNNSEPKENVSPHKVYKKITKEYEKEDLENILGFLKVTRHANLQNECKIIIDSCQEGEIDSLIEKLSDYLEESDDDEEYDENNDMRDRIEYEEYEEEEEEDDDSYDAPPSVKSKPKSNEW